MTPKVLISKWANPTAVSESASLVESAAFIRNTNNQKSISE